MATATIPMQSGLKVRAFNILNGSPAVLTFGANFRGVIFCTGTSGLAINGIMSVSSNSSATVVCYKIAECSNITLSTSGSALTLSATTTVNCYVISLGGADLPAIA